MEPSAITLESICNGAVPEIFNRDFREVLNNIMDPNTAPEKPRTITMKFTFKPTEDRSGMSVDLSCRSGLQPAKLVKSQLHLSRHSGTLQAYAHDLRQGALFDPKEDQTKPMSVVK